MFMKSIKTFLAVGVVAAGAAVSTTGAANAGGNFSLYIGNGYGGGIHYGNGYRRHSYGHRHHRRGCGPRRALNKAYRIGVNRPHISRINHRKIAVVGYNHGFPAKVVFKRTHRGCKVIKTRGLY